MKKYVFIAMNICNIGGSEQYLYNKTTFLEQQGYDCHIISGMRGRIMIAGLAKYAPTIVPNVMYPPCLFTRREIEATIRKIMGLIRFTPSDTCMIESDGVDEAKWGELLARECKGKHLVLNVQEVHDYSQEEIAFLRFKYDRRELAGITEKSVNGILKDDSLAAQPWSRFSPYCNNVVDDAADPFSDKLRKDAALTFGSIGRLEKPFVIPMLELLCRFFAENGDKTYNLVLIGGTQQKGVLKKITGIVSSCTNVHTIVTDLIYPIPRALIKNIDVFISTSGAADVSYLEHRPTIKVHPVTAAPAGIVGHSFTPEVDSMFDSIPDKTVLDLLQDILDGKIWIEYPHDDQYIKYREVMHAEFARQLNMAETPRDELYYETSGIGKEGIKYSIYRMLGTCLGGEKMQTILDLLRSVK